MKRPASHLDGAVDVAAPASGSGEAPAEPASGSGEAPMRVRRTRRQKMYANLDLRFIQQF